jgi:hypothetical protein
VGGILLAAAGVGFWFLRPTSHAAPKTVPLTSYPGWQITPAFSPDGKQVAFAWDGEKGDNFDIYVKLVLRHFVIFCEIHVSGRKLIQM